MPFSSFAPITEIERGDAEIVKKRRKIGAENPDAQITAAARFFTLVGRSVKQRAGLQTLPGRNPCLRIVDARATSFTAPPAIQLGADLLDAVSRPPYVPRSRT
jgi:hypothetical protein